MTRRLGEAAIADRLDEVVYRLDGQVAHLLLDEFQDTSALQWRVLRPFAQRVIRGGEDRSFFCVGDVKQAIYGWRGGVAEIFDALDDEFGGLPSQALNESFRSSPVVIDCVNQVFEGDRRQPRVAEVPGRGPEMVAAVHSRTRRPEWICPAIAAWSRPRRPATARSKGWSRYGTRPKKLPGSTSSRPGWASACSSAATRPWPG